MREREGGRESESDIVSVIMWVFSSTSAPLPPLTQPGVHPILQPYLSIPAGLQFTAQLVEIMADILDTPLPYPLHRHLSILLVVSVTTVEPSLSGHLYKQDTLSVSNNTFSGH